MVLPLKTSKEQAASLRRNCDHITRMTIPCVKMCLLAGCCIAIPASSNNNKYPFTSFSSSVSTCSKYPYTILSSTASECSKQQNSTSPCLQKSLATLPSCCRMDLAGFNSQLSAASLDICLFWTIFWAVSNSRMRQDFPAFSCGSQEAHHNYAGILNLHANSRRHFSGGSRATTFYNCHVRCTYSMFVEWFFFSCGKKHKEINRLDWELCAGEWGGTGAEARLWRGLSWCWHHSLLYNLSNGQFPFTNPDVELHILSVLWYCEGKE